MSPSSQLRAVDAVERPEDKTTQENAQANRDHRPHRLQYVKIPGVFALLLRFLLVGQFWTLLSLHVVPMALAIVRSDVHLHHIHAPEEDDSRQKRISILMECRILKVVIVAGDGQGQRAAKDSQRDLHHS